MELPERICQITIDKEVVRVGRRSKEYTVTVTHSYVHNPGAVERGLQLWAAYLAQQVGRRLAEEARQRRNTGA
ncbi:MAG: hypothetical protein K0R39_3515 [Symbiobacteriaceae bacterium]|jgi:hypothetical protein|nr:hypothetical protein [Symbiobacteriaceae bacterium]